MPIHRDAKGRFAGGGGSKSGGGKGGTHALAKRGVDHVLAKSKPAAPAAKAGATSGASAKGSKTGFKRVSAKKKAADTAYMDRFLKAKDATKKKNAPSKAAQRAAALKKAQAAMVAGANKKK